MSKDSDKPKTPATAGPAAGAAPETYDPERSRARFKEWFPKLTDTQVASLLVYLSELNKFNKAVNLVSPQTLPMADAVHVADGVFAAQMIRAELVAGNALYDLGTGNGIPGIIVGLLDPSLKVVLVDRDERKLEFCKHVAAAAKAGNISVLKAEVEELPKHLLVNVIARGFAPLPKALLMTRNVVKKRWTVLPSQRRSVCSRIKRCSFSAFFFLAATHAGGIPSSRPRG